MGGLALTFAGQFSLSSFGLTGATITEDVPGVQATMVLTFNETLSAVSNGRGDFSAVKAFGQDWDDAGAGGTVAGNTLTITLFSQGGSPGTPPLGFFVANTLPIVSSTGATWGSQSFPLTEV